MSLVLGFSPLVKQGKNILRSLYRCPLGSHRQRQVTLSCWGDRESEFWGFSLSITGSRKWRRGLERLPGLPEKAHLKYKGTGGKLNA